MGVYNENNDNDSQQQQQLQKQQKVLPYWQKAQIDMELAIAKETRDELQEVEAEFNELNEMFKDLKMTLDEQSTDIKQISQNVEDSLVKANEGLEDLQKARKKKRILL